MKREDVTKIFEGATEEQVSALLNIHSADIGNAKKALETERDSLKEQLKTAQDSLKGFEGVDVKDLQAKVTALTADLAAKQKEHEAKIADMEFSSALDAAISGSKAKNAKAVRALLDVDTLKASKNQQADIAAAIKKCQEENDYLFGSDEPIKKSVHESGGTGNGGSSPLAAMRAAMGLPAEK